jgi:hypothetical protein
LERVEEHHRTRSPRSGASLSREWSIAGIVGVASLTLAACGGSSHQAPSTESASGGTSNSSGGTMCQYLVSGDFMAIGKTLHGQPIANHDTNVQVRDCYYDLGTENDLAYLDFFDTPNVGQQNYTNATNPNAGGGTPAPVSGVGDSAYWLPNGNTLFVKKGSTVFQLKLNESGKSNSQIQADATTLASRIAARLP